ncbi:replication initiator protein A [Lusitaniella coriacea LEGE 07157]|uniref:Replication initiator protein A n=1 Tax=Lusitaniella coriacea LEGE 07157 TaxID=945747 RepID=A0A8J7DY33_9CYAN|nr:replication initiator protein A [Lusitaniella coriacea]MBE9117200.1 replication initiator protein A [Lusitaniella coriacea LEGE 07157]
MGKKKPSSSDAQLKLFSAIFTDIVTRDTQETMEVPFLSLSKKPRFTPINYTSNGVKVIVSGGEPYGIANIWDWDLIMWLLSQIRQALDFGEPISRKVRFSRRAFLKEARREVGGAQYGRLEKSIARLKNTTVTTTIRAPEGKTVMFNWIEYVEIDRDTDGYLQNVVVILPEWLFEAVCERKLILSIHKDYFLLTGGLERWLYRFVRKQAGNNKSGWTWKLRTLHERSGSLQRYSDFVGYIRKIASKQQLLDYKLNFFSKNKEYFLHAQRVFVKENVVTEVEVPPSRLVNFLSLKTTTYEKAKQIAPGYDIYALEDDWRKATAKNSLKLQNPDVAFLAWCKKVAERNPLYSSNR